MRPIEWLMMEKRGNIFSDLKEYMSQFNNGNTLPLGQEQYDLDIALSGSDSTIDDDSEESDRINIERGLYPGGDYDTSVMDNYHNKSILPEQKAPNSFDQFLKNKQIAIEQQPLSDASQKYTDYTRYKDELDRMKRDIEEPKPDEGWAAKLGLNLGAKVHKALKAQIEDKEGYMTNRFGKEAPQKPLSMMSDSEIERIPQSSTQNTGNGAVNPNATQQPGTAAPATPSPGATVSKPQATSTTPRVQAAPRPAAPKAPVYDKWNNPDVQKARDEYDKAKAAKPPQGAGASIEQSAPSADTSLGIGSRNLGDQLSGAKPRNIEAPNRQQSQQRLTPRGGFGNIDYSTAGDNT